MLTIIGLGNPGRKYKKSRHNVGYMFVDGIVSGQFLSGAVSQKKRGLLQKVFHPASGYKKFPGMFEYTRGTIQGKEFLIVKPLTFMNDSGRAIMSLLTRGLLRDLSEMLVVVDDVDLELGRLRLRDKGSAGGHNGLKSIIACIGSEDFARLRIGIGPRPNGDEMVDYVLSDFHHNEVKTIGRACTTASDIVEAWVTGGIADAQKIFAKVNPQDLA